MSTDAKHIGFSNRQARFPLGRILATPGALDALAEDREASRTILGRHALGDWGDVPPEDKDMNDQALTNGSRLLSAYTLATGVKVWIITEADRASTTILLPEEY